MENQAVPISKDNESIEKDMNKCINCGNCLKICIDEAVASMILEKNGKAEALCINCGQCINTCPKEALHEKFDYLKVKEILHNKQNKKIIISVAPAIRVTLAEEFDYEVGTNIEGKIPSIIKKLGADYAFDITFGADITVIEEAYELVQRLKNKKNLPQFSSCCPSWVKYVEIFYPELIPHLSTTKSPIAIQSSLIKTYFASKNNIDPQDIIHIVVAPCTAKKMEINRKELSITNKDTNYLLTTREFIKLIKEENIDIKELTNSNFDSIFGKGSGSGVIFGTSGGVCEAVLKTAYYFYTGKNIELDRLEFNALKKDSDIKETAIYFDDRLVKVAVCSGIKTTRELIDKVLKKEVDYDFIEVMSCHGGCINGGGQPSLTDKKNISLRSKALINEDKNMKTRFCHENPNVQKIYKEYLKSPNSDKAYEVLHTIYEDKTYLLKGDYLEK